MDATGHEAFVFCLVSLSTREEICEAKHSLQGQLVPEERTRSHVGFLIHPGLTGVPCAPGQALPSNEERGLAVSETEWGEQITSFLIAAALESQPVRTPKRP